MGRLLVLLCAVAAVAAVAAVRAANPPNILFLLTDDQDVMLGGLDPETKIRQLLTEQGLFFTNAFVHTPICCPSRSSYLSGRYLHNGGALNNSVAGNCAGQDWVDDAEKDTFGVHLHDAGYVTSYAGKYLNDYGLPGSPGCSSRGGPGCGKVPPGWDFWLGLLGNSKYYNYNVSRDGTVEQHGTDYATDYFPDLVANRTIDFIYDTAKSHPGKPILAVNAWPSPHGPHTPAPQYKGHFQGRKAPRTPNWNASEEHQQQKHWLARQQYMIDDKAASQIDFNFAQRWETLLSVDDHVALMVKALEDTGRLDNTFIIYTSDHGFQLGQQRFLGDKRQLYENDIRIPFIVRGPGVPRNKTESHTILNIDVAPTFVDIATGKLPSKMNGRSFFRFLKEDTTASPDDWRTDFMIDYHGEGGPCHLYQCPVPPPNNFHEIDASNNTYACVRTLSDSDNSIYCEFADNENFIEYYDINKDPWQLENTYQSLSSDDKARLKKRLEAFRECTGAACRSL